MDEYWAAISQIVPVIALAVVLEARGITSGWTKETPRIPRVTLSMAWAVLLLALAATESAALNALRGEPGESWWPTVAEYAIAAGLGILVLGPVTEFLIRGNAETAARLFTTHPIARFGIWRMHRRNLRMLRHIDVMVTDGWGVIADSKNMVAGFEKNIDETEQRYKESAEQMTPDHRAELEEQFRQARIRAIEMRKRWEEVAAAQQGRMSQHRRYRQEYLDAQAERPDQLRETVKAERDRLTSILLSLRLTGPADIPPPPPPHPSESKED